MHAKVDSRTSITTAHAFLPHTQLVLDIVSCSCEFKDATRQDGESEVNSDQQGSKHEAHPSILRVRWKKVSSGTPAAQDPPTEQCSLI